MFLSPPPLNRRTYALLKSHCMCVIIMKLWLYPCCYYYSSEPRKVWLFAASSSRCRVFCSCCATHALKWEDTRTNKLGGLLSLTHCPNHIWCGNSCLGISRSALLFVATTRRRLAEDEVRIINISHHCAQNPIGFEEPSHWVPVLSVSSAWAFLIYLLI